MIKRGETNDLAPIKIIVEDIKDKFAILKSAKHLRQINIDNSSRISISIDQTVIERQRFNALNSQRKILNEENKLNNTNNNTIKTFYYGIRNNNLRKIYHNQTPNTWIPQLYNHNDFFNNNFISTLNVQPFYFNYNQHELLQNANDQNILHYNNNNNNNISTMNVSVEISLISFNINGCKRNLAFLQNLLNNHDIIYLCETWLLDSDIMFYFKNFTITHNIHHKADMLFPPKTGRPFGGRAFLVQSNLFNPNHFFWKILFG